MIPILGLTYWYDAPNQTWKATGRPDIPLVITPPPDPVPTSGYGSGGYGDNPYGD